MAQQAVSPMMQQYFEIKKQHPDEILFYRVGDFYEMFYDDAITASRELELTLTGKACGKEERAPMCGVPFHSYETYVARLIAKGYKVAICEQMEDPALAKGLVKRDIIRVVTPGTVIESSMLSEDKNNYLCSIFLKKHRRKMQAGVCFADISTGEAYATELESEKMGGAIITELCRYMPSEILINTPMLDLKGRDQLHQAAHQRPGGAAGGRRLQRKHPARQPGRTVWPRLANGLRLSGKRHGTLCGGHAAGLSERDAEARQLSASAPSRTTPTPSTCGFPL